MSSMKFFKPWSSDPNDKIIIITVLSFHHQIFFSCIVREEPDAQECLVEVYRLLKSTAYQLYLVMQQNHVLQDLVTFFTSRGVSRGAVYMFYGSLLTYVSHMHGICSIWTIDLGTSGLENT